MADRRESSAHTSKPRAIPPSSSPPTHGTQSPAESFSRHTSTQRLASPIPSYRGSPAVRQIPTPSQLNTGEQSGNQTPQTPLPGLGTSKASTSGPGESVLAAALKGSFKSGSPPRFDVPPTRPLSPNNAPFEVRGPRSNYGSFDQRQGSPLPYEDPEIVRRHLVRPGGPSSSAAAGSPTRNAGAQGTLSRWFGLRGNKTPQGEDEDSVRGGADDEFSSLRLQGGDITRQIYRWTEQQEAEAKTQGRPRRSQSFHLARPRPEQETLDIDTIKQPGGFRRNHIRRVAQSPSPSRDDGGSNRSLVPTRPKRTLLTNNFLEFLSLYGHFAGEELDDEDELEVDDYFASDTYGERDLEGGSDDEGWEQGESSALLTPAVKRRIQRKEKKTSGASPSGAALLLLKSFVGTGVLFLPRAFLNGGMLFSNVVLLFVAILSYYCFILLVITRLKVPASFGDMGGILYGPWMRNLINFSLVISQIGFSSAYIVFTSENLQAFILAVSHCQKYIDIKWMILLQMVVFLPLSLYRNLNNIQKMALLADVFIVLGLIYLYYYDILTIVAQHGVADIKLFNFKDWTLFIGTAIFTFEGIGLVIPIQESMKEPSKFPPVLAGVMVVITVVFTSMGALSYAAYGSKTKTVVISNMPQDSKMVNGVQFIYSLAILLSTPLQFFPAIEITSKWIFKKSGKNKPYIKWKKNVYRFFMVVFCAMIAWMGANDLDKFVALVGSFACVPLVYIYPPMLHYKAVAQSRKQRIADVTLCVFGFVVMAYTTALTVMSWIAGGSPKPPGYCDE